MNTLTSVILSALQDTRDGGLTVEERAETIADAVRAETFEPPTGALGQWIASLRVGDTLTVDDIHRFVRVELALRNADKHHQQARAMTAERDAAIAECHEQARLNGMGSEREAKLMAERDALTARLAACERVVEAVADEGMDPLLVVRLRECVQDLWDSEQYAHIRGTLTEAAEYILSVKDALRAAVATAHAVTADTVAVRADATAQGEHIATLEAGMRGVGQYMGQFLVDIDVMDCVDVSTEKPWTTPHATDTDTSATAQGE